MTNNVLYQIYDEDGGLLYVGASTNIFYRMHNHSVTQPWWDEAAKIELERFDTFEELMDAERETIFWREPRYNIIHSERRRPNLSRPRRQRGDGSVYQREDGTWVGSVELPSVNGKRRRKRVMGKTREVAELKLAQLRADLAS